MEFFSSAITTLQTLVVALGAGLGVWGVVNLLEGCLLYTSYERQGVELLPTVHEGATVRAMEKKGIRTEKGEFNRWIRATNAVIRDIKKKITLLFDWIAEAKAELAKPQAPDLVSLLNAYYTQRRAGAYSQKGKVSNLKEMNETFNYLDVYKRQVRGPRCR